MKPLKVMVAVGARPNYMKAAPLVRALTNPEFAEAFVWAPIELKLIHTGQHYEDGLSKVLFEELALPQADVNLNVGSGPHGQQTELILQRFEPVLEEEWPDVLVVVGDVNSTLAARLQHPFHRPAIRRSRKRQGSQAGRHEVDEKRSRNPKG